VTEGTIQLRSTSVTLPVPGCLTRSHFLCLASHLSGPESQAPAGRPKFEENGRARCPGPGPAGLGTREPGRRKYRGTGLALTAGPSHGPRIRPLTGPIRVQSLSESPSEGEFLRDVTLQPTSHGPDMPALQEVV
jgi:hypothetical protein